MKIYQKLTLGFLGGSLLLIFLGTVSLKINSGIKRDSKHLTQNSVIEVEAAKEMTRALQSIEAASQELLLERYQESLEKTPGSERKEIILAKNTIDKDLITFRENLETGKNSSLKLIAEQGNIVYDNYLDEEYEVNILKKIKINFLKYELLINKYIYLSETNPQEAYQLLEKEIEPLLRTRLRPLVIEYQQDALKELNIEANRIERSINRDNLLMAICAGVSTILSLISGSIIARQISQPLAKITKSALKLGQGKLEPIAMKNLENRKDELAILAKTFNQTIEVLKKTTVSKTYLDDIFDSTKDSLIIIDLAGKIIKVNQATLELLGYQNWELRQNNIGFILAESKEKIKYLQSQCNRGNCETNYLNKQGEKIPVTFSTSHILNETGEIQGILCVARDLIEKYRAAKALQASEERYALASIATNDGLWDWNLKTKQVYYSPRWKSLLGYQETEIASTLSEWFKLVHSDKIQQLKEQFVAHLKGKISQLEMTYPMLHKDGQYRWMLCRAVSVRDRNGKIYRMVGSHTDVTDRFIAEEKLRYHAFYDRLTGLPNRAFFSEELAKLLQQAKANSQYLFAVLFLDLDRFSTINDSLGHLAGDRLLIEFAARIKQCLHEENHLFARLGGDEFIITIAKIDSIKQASQLATVIQKQLDRPFQLQQQEIFVNVSIGIATANERYDRIEDIIRDADTAMYQAKAAGKARHVIFEPKMHQKAVSALKLENDLRRAIARQEFQVLYQPIYKLNGNSQTIIGFEALLRWLHPEKGIVSPAEFIPVAEETGAIVPIGWWAIEQAAWQMRQWQEQYPQDPPMTVSVNLSAKQIDANIFDRIFEILQRTGLKPESLKIEITENAIVNNTAIVAAVLKKIKALGIGLSIDDFGTGYSSLSYLHQLPIDTLKIDRSFIRDIETDKEKLELTKAILNLASNLAMETIAEGIETNTQLDLLQNLNCQLAQGYLFSKPVDSEKAEALISNRPSAIVS